MDADAADSRRHLTIRLRGGDHGDGEIPLDRLAEIAERTQDLTLRMARGLSGRAKAGRTPDQLAGAVRLMLVGLSEGSTTLDIAWPPLTAELDLGDGVPETVTTQTFQMLVDTIDALSNDGDLPELSEPAYDAVESWLDALTAYPEVEVSSAVSDGNGHGVVLQPREARRRMPDKRAATVTDAPVAPTRSVEGELYAVNLRTGRYGVEDDLGRSIPLDVPDDLRQQVADRLGDRIRATGPAKLTTAGLIEVLHVEELRPPASWAEADRTFRRADDLATQLAGIEPIASTDDLAMDDLTDEEADAFWAALGTGG